MSDPTPIHLALEVADLEASVAFYARYAGFAVVHRRREPSGSEVVWMHDGEKPFVLVLIMYARRSAVRMLVRRIARAIARFVSRPAHLGIPLGSRADVERRCAEAAAEGRLLKPARDGGPILGFYGMLADLDGYNLELSYGQESGMVDGKR